MTPQYFKAIRKAYKQTQAQFGEMLGLTREYIGQMERGDAPISVRTDAAVRYLATAVLGPGIAIPITDNELRFNSDAGLRDLITSRIANARKLAA